MISMVSKLPIKMISFNFTIDSIAAVFQDKNSAGRERLPSQYYIKKRPKHGPDGENPRTLALHH
jgi:hypothetical protein